MIKTMSNYLGHPISGGGGVTDHLQLTNIGESTHAVLDSFKSDILAQVDQDVRISASPEFVDLTSTSIEANSISTNTIQASSLQSTSVLADSVDTSEMSIDGTFSVLRNGQLKWRMQNDNDGDSLVFENSSSEDCLIIQQDKTVKLTSDLVTDKVFCSEISLDHPTDATINIRRAGSLQWSISNSGDTLIFENVNNDESVTMQLDQDGLVTFGDFNSYTFPKRIGNAGQVLTSDGFSNLEFRSPTTGRYVQTTTQSIVNIAGTTTATVFAPSPNSPGVGQFRIDGDSTSANLDTYILQFTGQLFTQQKDERIIIRLTNEFSNVLFTHDFLCADVKSDLPGEPFEYNMQISRFISIGNTDSLRINGIIEYNVEDGECQRSQSQQTVGVGSPNTQNLTLSWQFLNNTNTQANITSVIFQRVF
jgi:hypothetical protein